MLASQGIDQTTFDAIAAAYPGFDYSELTAANTWVVDATRSISLAQLKDAVTASRNRSGADLIVVKTGNVAKTITFTAARDTITVDDASPVMIVAWGETPLTINANGKTRAFVTTNKSNLALANIVATNGSAADGGAIRALGGLTLDRCAIYDSVSTGKGGGVYCDGDFTMANSVVSGNRAAGSGGGVYLSNANPSGSAGDSHIINSTITGNIAGTSSEVFGGGLYFCGISSDFSILGELTVGNTIVVQNQSSPTECDANIYNSAFMNEAEIARGDVPVRDSGRSADRRVG